MGTLPSPTGPLCAGLFALLLIQGLALAADDNLTERGKMIKEEYGSLGLKHHGVPTNLGYSRGAMAPKGGSAARSRRHRTNRHNVHRSYHGRGVRHHRR